MGHPEDLAFDGQQSVNLGSLSVSEARDRLAALAERLHEGISYDGRAQDLIHTRELRTKILAEANAIQLSIEWEATRERIASSNDPSVRSVEESWASYLAITFLERADTAELGRELQNLAVTDPWHTLVKTELRNHETVDRLADEALHELRRWDPFAGSLADGDHLRRLAETTETLAGIRGLTQFLSRLDAVDHKFHPDQLSHFRAAVGPEFVAELAQKLPGHDLDMHPTAPIGTFGESLSQDLKSGGVENDLMTIGTVIASKLLTDVEDLGALLADPGALAERVEEAIRDMPGDAADAIRAIPDLPERLAELPDRLAAAADRFDKMSHDEKVAAIIGATYDTVKSMAADHGIEKLGSAAFGGLVHAAHGVDKVDDAAGGIGVASGTAANVPGVPINAAQGPTGTRLPAGPEWPEIRHVAEVEVPEGLSLWEESSTPDYGDARATSYRERRTGTRTANEMLRASLGNPPSDHHDAHHIVPTKDGGPALDPIRERLREADIKPNGADNGVWLIKNDRFPNPEGTVPHQNWLHADKDYLYTIQSRLGDKEGDEFAAELAKIKDELWDGNFRFLEAPEGWPGKFDADGDPVTSGEGTHLSAIVAVGAFGSDPAADQNPNASVAVAPPLTGSTPPARSEDRWWHPPMLVDPSFDMSKDGVTGQRQGPLSAVAPTVDAAGSNAGISTHGDAAGISAHPDADRHAADRDLGPPAEGRHAWSGPVDDHLEAGPFDGHGRPGSVDPDPVSGAGDYHAGTGTSEGHHAIGPSDAHLPTAPVTSYESFGLPDAHLTTDLHTQIAPVGLPDAHLASALDTPYGSLGLPDAHSTTAPNIPYESFALPDSHLTASADRHESPVGLPDAHRPDARTEPAVQHAANSFAPDHHPVVRPQVQVDHHQATDHGGPP